MRLWIAEKPSLAKTLAEALGSARRQAGYFDTAQGRVSWCIGHLYELYSPEDYDERYKTWAAADLPILPGAWKRKATKRGREQLKVLRPLLKAASEVVNAGDPDREGQLLVDEVLEECGWKGKTLRIWLQDLTPAGIRKAAGQLKPNSQYLGLSQAAEARSRADWLVGMNLSRAYTIRGRMGGPGSGVRSVGRVQTPTLALVVRRDEEIENFVPRDFFTVQATFDAGRDRVFAADWQIPETLDGVDEEGRLLASGPADAVVARVSGQPAEIAKVERKRKSEAPPLPFTLADLQSHCSAKFGLSAQATLDVAQALYETHKLTSYPRTDCAYLSENQHGEAKGVLQAVAGNLPGLAPHLKGASLARRHKAFNNKKVGAHTGLIPTAQAGGAGRLSDIERKVYEAICKRYLGLYLPDHEFEQTVIEVACAGERFVAKGRRPLVAGWKALYGVEAVDDETGEDEAGEGDAADRLLPAVERGEAARCTDARRQDKKTKPPARYTEGTLIKAMANIAKIVTDPRVKARLRETAGIGTEATRASILEVLKKRDFLEAKGKKLISTLKGRALVHELPSALTSPDVTAAWEELLAEMADGKGDFAAFLAKQSDWVTRLVARAKEGLPGHLLNPAPAEEGPPCPCCQKASLRRREGRYGAFWGCGGYPKCTALCDDQDGTPNLANMREGKKPSAGGGGKTAKASKALSRGRGARRGRRRAPA